MHIITPMMGTEMTPLTTALHSRAWIGSTSKALISVPMPVAAMMMA